MEHCIYGTEGWEIVSEVRESLDLKKNYRTFRKDTFGSMELAEAVSRECLLDAEVDFVGVCTDLCVISNAIIMKTFNSEMRLSVISRACAGTTEDNHAAALAAMRSCQIDIVRSAAEHYEATGCLRFIPLPLVAKDDELSHYSYLSFSSDTLVCIPIVCSD